MPIYVAIGASLASVAQRRRRRQAVGISLAIFDEAFSKMDGKNAADDELLQGSRPADHHPRRSEARRGARAHGTIVEIDRIGEQSRAGVVQLKDQGQTGLMAMDPDLMSDADLAVRMAAE